MKRIEAVLFLASMLAACEPLELGIGFKDPSGKVVSSESKFISKDTSTFTVDYPIVPDNHPAIECMIKKAHQIADIKWTPLRSIPSLSEAWIPAGTTMYGIPYSSVKEKDKFVGQEVTFYTFMSAVMNPRSVLYTENVKNPPYKGENCGVYYGTVCSMAVNYALGIERPIESKMYASLPNIAKVKQQEAAGVCAGDILWSKGHVVLVLSINNDVVGKPSSFTILESSGNTRIKQLSLDEFNSRWERVGWIAYRYMDLANNINYTPIPYYHNQGDPDIVPDYNTDISISRGDKSCYREGEDVVVNIFSSSFSQLILLRNGTVYKVLPVDSVDIVLHALPYGNYKAYLRNQEKTSDEVDFEVIDAHSFVRKKNVFFSSRNACPEYYVICDFKGEREVIRDISEIDRENGFLSLGSDYHGYYLKVFFKGNYGRVSNDPILL